MLGWTVMAMLATAVLAEEWKPVPKRQSPALYHGSVFVQQPQIEDRYSNLNHLPFDGRFHHDFGPQQTGGGLVPTPDDDCGLYKIGFNQDLYYQYAQYKEAMPDLKEFTLCVWTKFQNHSNDHPLFNYAVGDNPRAIASWVSNTDRASYYSMAVAGHTFYRLNYPLRLNKWYHSCQSWNGRTGEWQIWVNNERVGRGFHNRLVGHVIKGGGVAVSGQEQSQLSGSTGAYADAKKASRGGMGGMLGEITMLQLYHVALTAGKAHKDHKHHHVHHFAHDGSPLPLASATAAPPPPPPQPPRQGSVLVGNQIAPARGLNLVPAVLPGGLRLTQQYANGQFGPGRAVSEQLFNAAATPPFFPGRGLFTRDAVRSKRGNPEEQLDEPESGESKKQTKRGLVALSDGSVVDDSLLGETFEQSLLNGLAGLGENVPVQNIQKEKVDEREPAEAEVKAVMDMCTGCSEEPFQKALVLSWRHTPKKLFGGAYYYPAVPACKAF